MNLARRPGRAPPLPSNEMNVYELSRVIDLVSALNARFLDAFPGNAPSPRWQLISLLMKAHIEERPVTLSGLIDASGLSYGTATRHCHAMIEEGLITCVPRTDSAKTFHYWPSDRLLADFSRYAQMVKADLAGMLDGRSSGKAEDVEKYYFGGRHQSAAMSDSQLTAVRMIEGVGDTRFLLSNDWYSMALRHVWSDMRRHIGTAQNFHLLPVTALHDAALRNATREVSEYDILALTPEMLREFAEAGHILPLPDQGEPDAPVLHSFHPRVWQMARPAGALMGFPAYVSIDLLAYRPDLLAEAALDRPATPEQVLKCAASLHAPRRGRYGIAWSGRPGRAMGETFMALQSALGGAEGARLPETCNDPLHHLWVHGGREAYDLLREFQALSAPEVLHFGPDEALRSFGGDHAGLLLVSSINATRLEFDLTSLVKKRVAYMPVPRRRQTEGAPLKGLVLAVPSNLPPARRNRAFQILRWLTEFDLDEQESLGRIPMSPLFSLLRDPELARNSPVRNLLRSQLQQATPRPAIAYTDRGHVPFVTRLGARLHDALSQGQTAPAAFDLLRAE